MYSLSARVFTTQSVVLVIFFALTVLALDNAFRSTAERATRDRLQLHVYALLAAAETGDGGHLTLPEGSPDPHFKNPASGLFGRIQDEEGTVIWRSGSVTGRTLPDPPALSAGESWFVHDDVAQMFIFAFSVEWEAQDGRNLSYSFQVAEELDNYHEQLARWRQQMFIWFGVSMILLLAAQVGSMRLVLRPLRQVETEISEVEDGARQALSDQYPHELAGVTGNLNTLIENERTRLARYRDTLGNLAHSLKTPLAVIRGVLERADGSSVDPELGEQVDTIDRIVGYQLRRAAASGGTSLGHAPVEIDPELSKVVDALERVYADRGVRFERTVEDGTAFRGDVGDLMEILGNLLDNAFKYGAGLVRVTARPAAGGPVATGGMILIVEDDGPGIPEPEMAAVLARGARMDQNQPGQGIGLAVVSELAQLHGGWVELARSDLGGIRVRLEIPPAGRG